MVAHTEKLECDLVMRGGITSGIVYPRAIAKLATTYNFRSIGGTSAGAIAAAATAAASYGAKIGEDHFQTDIRGLPERLAEKKKCKTELERLFHPQPETRGLFKVLMAGLGRESWWVKAPRVIAAAISGYWGYVLAALALIFVPLLVLAKVYSISGAALWALLGTGAILALLVLVVAVAYGMARDIRYRLPANGYGMCSGSSNMQRDDAGVLPLTDWLHVFFQDVANKDLDAPVTFADLWGTRDPTKERDVELVLMTTNVTRGVSHRFPFIEGSWGQLFFKEKEFAALFPASVVKWMTGHPAPVRDWDRIDTEGHIALPAAPDLPILLGARMSLSFPFLLSAVPLYAANFERKPKNGRYPLERCWFSDGGLTSNFPIHFFDAPLPLRPTFGINLIPDTVDVSETMEVDGKIERVSGVKADKDTSEPANAPADKIWMPAKNSSGIGSAARFNNFTTITGFFSALFDTARNWGDTELTAMPGYRDRVVHVKLAEDEGGLNLNMPPEIIKALGDRGERAGALVTARFAPEPDEEIELTWDNHRWIRFRGIMAALEDVARRFRATWEAKDKQKPWRSYAELLGRGKHDKPTSYPLPLASQRAFATEATNAFVNFVADWTGDRTFDRGDASKEGGSPRPKPVLRMMPPGSNDPRVERAGTQIAEPPAAE